MERILVGAAIVAAFAIAAAATFGGTISGRDGFSISLSSRHDEDGGRSPAGEAVGAEAKVFAADEVQIEDAAAVLIVIPEERADVSVSVTNSGPLPSPKVRLVDGRVIVDGGLPMTRQRCRSGPVFSVMAHGQDVPEGQLPVVTVRTPAALHLAVQGGVKTSVGASRSAEISLEGCGPTEIGPVSGDLGVSASGSGHIKADTAEKVELSLSGSAGADVGAARAGLSVSQAGSGHLNVARAGGPLEAAIAGSGSITIAQAAFDNAEIAIAGSGDVTIDGSVKALEADIAGSGDVRVSGAAESVGASIMGSGDVTVGSASGAVKRSVFGSGTVRVGGRD